MFTTCHAHAQFQGRAHDAFHGRGITQNSPLKRVTGTSQPKINENRDSDQISPVTQSKRPHKILHGIINEPALFGCKCALLSQSYNINRDGNELKPNYEGRTIHQLFIKNLKRFANGRTLHSAMNVTSFSHIADVMKPRK